MLSELWNNRTNIITNYQKILHEYFPSISSRFIILILIALGLILIYTIIRYYEWKRHSLWQLEDNNINNQELNKNNQQLNKNNESIENFTNSLSINKSEDLEQPFLKNSKSQINFIQPGDHACSNLMAYIDAEYLPYMNQPNIQARGLDTLSELTTKYHRGICLPITLNEQKLVVNAIIQSINNLPTEFKSIKPVIEKWLKTAYFGKTVDWLEGGMPHTHGRAIMMRPNWFSLPSEGIGIFYHELTHIWQRYQATDFNNLYNSWGFIPLPSNDNIIKGLETVMLRSRLNPDALPNNRWVWHHPSSNSNIYWIDAIYPNISPNSLHDIEFLAYPLTLSGDNNYIYLGTAPIKLDELKSFSNFFGSGRNHYHPNELAAQYMDDILTGSITNTSIPAITIFKDWLLSQTV